MDITIRRAVPGDAAVIVEFNSRMAEETEHRSLDEKILTNGVRAILGDDSKGMYFVATAGGGIVGQLMITYEWSDWRDGNFWWIQSVYVRKEFRQQGVFRALYEHVEEMAKKKKTVCGLRLYVERNNARAQSTYEKLGMKRSVYEMFEKDFVLG
ncbi:MAG TPA: GNAT family N-acetyltransferase [Bacteroidota bacterium]|nr:GNAT family N-acetyltransferase [Bacteroidota bacterium]